MHNSLKSLAKTLLSVTILSVGLLGLAQAATIENPQGEVMLHKAGAAADAWTPVQGSMAVDNGDSVKTMNGTCNLVYGDQATFAVQNNTTLEVNETSESQDIGLKLGNIQGKVNKDKVTKPFQVVTPTAVAAVRGTEVDFGFNENGELTVDLHNGTILVYNEDEDKKMEIPLEGNKTLVITYDKENGTIKVKNECSSDGKIEFSVLGQNYVENPCDEVTINLETAEGPGGPPGTGGDDDSEQVDEGADDGSDDGVPPPVSGELQ